MAPGRRKTRSVQIDESNNTSEQVNCTTCSTTPIEQTSQQQQVHITCSIVHVLPPRLNSRTTRSTIHRDPHHLKLAPPCIVQSQQATSIVDFATQDNVSQRPSCMSNVV